MCNTHRYSESGKPCGVQRCEEYEALKQERDALLKVREAADAEITSLRRALGWTLLKNEGSHCEGACESDQGGA